MESMNHVKLLKAIPAIKIAIWQVLDSKYNSKLKDLEVNPSMVSINIKINMFDHAAHQKEIIQDVLEVVSWFSPVSPEIQFVNELVQNAKTTFLNLLMKRERRKEYKKKEPFFAMARYSLKLNQLEGIHVRIRGKRGSRRYMAVASTGKFLRGTKLKSAKDSYVGQVSDSRGTTGVKITVIKKLPTNLKPSLILRKGSVLPTNLEGNRKIIRA